MEATHSLSVIELLAGLPAPELNALEARCHWRDYKARQTICEKDDDSADLLFVVKGKVSITSYSITGKEIAFNEVETGGYFGELAMIDGRPRSATVSAASACRIAALPAAEVRQMIARHPDLAWAMLEKLARVIRATNERLVDFATLSAQQRVVAELLRLSRPDPGNLRILSIYPLPTQATLASRIGATRETVARVLSELTRGGLIHRHGRILYIDRPDRLKELKDRLGQPTDA
ncbi:Crp/Fnr family transcriptional regulator [Roseospirillum parvum]|uniref:cAMP-binding domain of CRP or a regulatory subunit of cAMP-dependent protein kinases n=1 Tax=Roseospirillum parvum TaxID=83401 RepID=A0A1G8ATM2_9PROT|nr:Crp/Fnr family transcriptional regulator [Roseospirillum parvum]SDH24194.1 cAMP-binding domain of CRP or a regulatory subunit of cAMP-dependent protein kinases [Roseospirillum parvum]